MATNSASARRGCTGGGPASALAPPRARSAAARGATRGSRMRHLLSECTPPGTHPWQPPRAHTAGMRYGGRLATAVPIVAAKAWGTRTIARYKNEAAAGGVSYPLDPAHRRAFAGWEKLIARL